MRTLGMTMIITFTLLFGVQSVAQASNEQAEENFIVGGNQTAIIKFMQDEHMPIGKVYSTFSIISSNLTDTQQQHLKSKFPDIQIQSNRIYEQTKDTELQSIKTIQATSEFASPYTGRGVKIAVLDSGIDTEHRDLRVKGGHCTLVNDCAPGIPYDDDNGHGTHVAGIIAALKNDTGIVGIAPNADLYSIKALNAFGVGTTNSLVDGIEWAIQNSIDILNLSITTEKNDLVLKAALEAAYEKGILIVGSAGNNGESANKSVMYPAKYDSVIAVAAVNSDLTHLKESAIGEEVDIAAPGELILSTYPSEWDYIDGRADGYTRLSGTSMATPHVTGILALYKERFPEKTNVELRKLINDTAKDLEEPGKDSIFGHGFVQYVANLDEATALTVKNELGKVTLTTNNPEAVKIEFNGQRIQPVNGQWHIYGVNGTVAIRVTTTNAAGKTTVEKQYITFTAPNYSDVTNAQRFAGPIGFLSHHQQIKGFDDGTFKPYATITRAEAAVLIGRALDFSAAPRKTNFKDVPTSSFASGYIQAAVDADIISGFSDGTFRPGSYVTRAEMAILMTKAFDLENNGATNFKDVQSSMAAYESIQALAASQITTGYGDGTFKPYNNMTRADFSVFLARVQNDFFK